MRCSNPAWHSLWVQTRSGVLNRCKEQLNWLVAIDVRHTVLRRFRSVYRDVKEQAGFSLADSKSWEEIYG